MDKIQQKNRKERPAESPWLFSYKGGGGATRGILYLNFLTISARFNEADEYSGTSFRHTIVVHLLVSLLKLKRK